MLPLEPTKNFKHFSMSVFRGTNTYRNLEVIRNLSFEVKKGDFYGIVGRNGSGKSTLLKLLAGIYSPDGGEIEVNGSLVPFIELGVGFNPELSGRENVYLNCALLGFTRARTDSMYDEIVDFAELHDFMEQKLKNYSSGMQVRLAFSVAIMARGDILILDEILAVGDETFQQKCFSYFAKLKKEKKTVILVTHNMGSVQDFCNKVLLIDKSSIIEEGNAAEISQKYRKLNEAPKNAAVDTEKLFASVDSIEVKADAQVDDAAVRLNAVFNSSVDIDDAVVSLVVCKETGEWVYRWTSDEQLSGAVEFTSNNPRELSFEIENIFPDGVFHVNYSIKSLDRSKDYGTWDETIKFSISHSQNNPEDKYWKLPAKFSLH
ncbi:MAG: ABC transporter ATP-binding protein [Candidatus Ancillula trichonymphae]|jgi:ABC-2 type transport system ATP-binding protein|nr:ABC transporter ATP-binding protein [Candidatus Ancillula trichonymphae]